MSINWLSVLIAALIPMVMGFIYYSPKVLGNVWMNSIGLKPEDAKKSNMVILFGVSFLMSLLLSQFILYNVDGPCQDMPQFDSFKHGAFHGLLLSTMVAAPVMITNGLFELRKWKTMLINVVYWVICMVLMGGILDMMNHSPFPPE